MNECTLCRSKSLYVSKELGVCLACLRDRPDKALEVAFGAHKKSREAFGLPVVPPDSPDGLLCNLCVNQCRMAEGQVGYCGLRRNRNGRIVGVTPREAKLSWYHDPLPTNCVGDWVCPGGTGAGYPKYAYCDGPEKGYKNLAVFFHACSFNCLYCQNWQFKRSTYQPGMTPVSDLVSDVDARTSCICYFGGDPAPQLPFSIKASERASAENPGRVLRHCWETNGSMNPGLLDRIMDLAVGSGGLVKFDLKAWDENLHKALTGASNRRTLENFKRAAQKARQRPDPFALIAGTLLVSGYVDEVEVAGLAGYIASIDRRIPYSLLAFHPHFFMRDLPVTSRSQAEACLAAARDAGLENVRLANEHLLA